ncbi:MAG: hypothetical protein H0W18_17665 [Acidobacteria bacterium]|nr:hypothetical protein [Acidobacteriota bacterium]
MDDKERLRVLEAALAQMLKPVKGIPFSVIIKALAERQVVQINKADPADIDLVKRLEQAIRLCGADLKAKPIKRPRPNEVGNDVEGYVMRALPHVGLTAARPTSSAGLGKSTGYPDILIRDSHNRATYLECKIFAQGTAGTTMRSFYLSPSESFKVSIDARHLLLAFGMSALPVAGSRDSLYIPESYKLVDLHDLLCDVKYVFNSDNRRLDTSSTTLLEGKL